MRKAICRSSRSTPKTRTELWEIQRSIALKKLSSQSSFRFRSGRVRAQVAKWLLKIAGAMPELMLPKMYQDDGFGSEMPMMDRYSDDFSGPHLPSAPEEADYGLIDYFNLCRCCARLKDRCENAGEKTGKVPQRRQRSPEPTSRPATTTHGTLQRKSNADPCQGNKMESTTAGALAVSAPPPTAALPDHPYLDLDLDLFNPIAQAEGPGTDPFPLGQDTSHLDAPQTPHPNDQVQQSDARDAARPETPGTERAANILANGPLHVCAEADPLAYDSTTTAAMGNMTHENHNELAEDDIWAIEDEETFDSQDAQGFAKLMFPDGDYIVTTHDVEIGRNMEVAAHWKRQQKELRREQQREERRERVPPARKELAQRELQMYQQEPSQPSLTGDNGQHADASNSSHSLEGRPAPQSAFSETGGALAFAQDSDEEAGSRRGRKKRRSGQHSKSSTSTTSVVPANLHPPVISAEYSQRELFTDDGEPYSRTLATLPIHTQVPEDINKISKKHLLFSFNFQEECWELNILGVAAYVNAEQKRRGDTVTLSHNDVIQISSVWIKFKLPDSHRSSPGLSRGTFSQVGLEDVEDLSEEDEQPVATSPVRRLSNALEDAESSDNEPAEPKKGKPKLKLKGVKKLQKEKKAAASKKKPQEDEKTSHKISLKKQQRRRSDESPSPDEEKKVEKGKKPKEAIEQPPELKVEESIEGPPTAPPVFTAEPGSALASVPVDELPQKRKGPGRPPKNGLVSKRDQALVKKKERDYEKAGLAAPPFNKILELVRAETKQKEMMAKMQSGTLPAGTEMPPPLETDLAATAVKAPAAPTPAENGDEANGMPSESSRRPSSPRPKRVARSPSPMKPESSYTEEEMKKPTATYVHILDEILRNHPSGHADLQEIYDRIQKRYPHFKYRAQTQGWQSSVRHNLLSAPRFKETGRSGKGKLWTIDYDVPLEREKKRKPTPPPRPPMPMMNGQYPPYGQQPYGGGYGPPNGQRPVNGGQGYYSPYQHGQPGQHPPNHNMPPRQGAPPSGQAPPNGGQAQPQADPFGGLVPEILAVRNAFLTAHATEETMQAKSDWISSCIVVFSNRFHGSADPPPDLAVEAPEERKAYADLDAIFGKYEKVKMAQQGSSNAQPAAAPPPNANNGASGTVHQPGPVQQHQQQTVKTAVADGVAYQNANGGLSPTTAQAPVVSTSQTQSGAQSHPQAPAAPANGVHASGSLASPHAVPTTATAQHAQAPPAYPHGANQPSQASPPQAMPSGAPQPGGHAPSGSNPVSHPGAPSASPPVNNRSAHPPKQPETRPAAPTHGTTSLPAPATNGLAQSPSQSQARPAGPYQAAMSAPAPATHGPAQPQPQGQEEPVAAQNAAMPVSASTSNGPAQSPQQSKAQPVASPAPAVQQPAEITGVKRAAEDDVVTESEAKRARVEE